LPKDCRCTFPDICKKCLRMLDRHGFSAHKRQPAMKKLRKTRQILFRPAPSSERSIWDSFVPSTLRGGGKEKK